MPRYEYVLDNKGVTHVPECEAYIAYIVFTLSKRSLKRSNKKSGRKKQRTNDVDIVIRPAPDSVLEYNAI